MRRISNLLLGFILVFAAGCADLHLGMKYQKVSMGKINNDSIYCYRFGWGIDAMACYITKKMDPCLELNGDEDICFGKGISIIYFHLNNDTLYLYSNIEAGIPKNFSGNIVLLHYDNQSYTQLEESYGKHQLEKVAFDKPAFEVNCNLQYDSSSKGMRRKN